VKKTHSRSQTSDLTTVTNVSTSQHQIEGSRVFGIYHFRGQKENDSMTGGGKTGRERLKNNKSHKYVSQNVLAIFSAYT